MKITIIGAGPGGYETALEAAGKGIEVTLVSAGPVGGTCLNEGCIPTKALLRSAEVLETVREAASYGVEAGECRLDFARAMARKDAVVEQLRSGVEFLLKHKLITLLRGKASLCGGQPGGGEAETAPHKVKVALDEGGEEIVESDYVIIATGSVAASLPIPGADLPGVISSKEMLSLEALPKSVCVIGAGVIGLEMASLLNSFGCEVSVLEYCPDILPRFDTDLAKRLKQSLSKRGISIETSAQVKSIEAAPEGLVTSYVRKEKEASVTAEKVLMAVGRRPALGSLNFEQAGIAVTPKGVLVDAYMQTSVPGIYAIGDIAGGYMLAHTATFQGRRALNHILAGCPSEGPVDSIRLDIVPAAVFTRPEAATVGLTEDECKANGLPIKVLKSFFRASGKAVAMGETDGFCKIVASEQDGRILGCHLFGPHSSDIIQEVTALLDRDATVDDLASIIHAHPTLSEVLLSAAKG
ncbi:MAG: dihydrolipoyl dehydrogenase [Bacteroidales bacterium]|nr:dihydrolipoyl dehydrogenase [Bacteroidales bacterium]